MLVPARNEADVLPSTLPALLAQDYPGAWRLVVVDDRSSDGTAEIARTCGARHVPGTDLPEGWVGKVWALEQAARHAGEPDYYLLTDADIRHAPRSLRRLVAESEAAGLALNSRMARLRCQAPAERLLIPPFVLFFNLLYPMRRVNDPRSRVAAAAGGCVLLRRDALERAGGFAAIRDRVIDDVSLARAVKPHRPDPPVREPCRRREPARARPRRCLANGAPHGVHRASPLVGAARGDDRAARAALSGAADPAVVGFVAGRTLTGSPPPQPRGR